MQFYKLLPPYLSRNRRPSLARADRTGNRGWYDPKSILYKVRADDGNLYILRQLRTKPDGCCAAAIC